MIILDPNKKVPLYEQLYREIRKSILANEFKEGERLKPIRVLAKELGVSHNTVNHAYMQLLSEGYIRATQGSGYYVEKLNYLVQQTGPDGESVTRKGSQKQDRIKWDFHFDSFDGNLFPWGKWKRNVLNAMIEESYKERIFYQENKGSRELRKNICTYIHHSRGIVCEPSQIIITPGTQHALEIVMNILPKKHYKVAVEEPLHEGIWQVVVNRGWEMEPIPVRDSGIDANLLEKTDCDLLYVMPSHQFPTGVTLSLDKRLQILEWARRRNLYIIENDYDNEFIYDKSPLLSLHSMDRNNHVIYMNSMARILSPEIRCGYLILPKNLVPVYEERYKSYFSSEPSYDQSALSVFIEDGSLERQARKMSVMAARKFATLTKVFHQKLHGLAEISGEGTGSFVLIRIHGLGSKQQVLEELLLRGIRIYDAAPCWHAGKEDCEELYLFGFGAIPEEQMEQACLDFAEALQGLKGHEI